MYCKNRIIKGSGYMGRMLWLILFSVNAVAVPVTVDIKSNKNLPVFQTVVYLEPTSGTPPVPAVDKVSVLDQVDRQFVPHILPIQKGSSVVFPNSDSIQHHVYSFSPAKQFELKLYRDSKVEPLLFETDGEVELGCNVHDWMLAYIWVVDTPYFAKTSQDGVVVIDVPVGHYTLKVWHPRIQDDLESLSQNVNINQPSVIEIKLQKELLQDLSFYQQRTDKLTDYDD